MNDIRQRRFRPLTSGLVLAMAVGLSPGLAGPGLAGAGSASAADATEPSGARDYDRRWTLEMARAVPESSHAGLAALAEALPALTVGYDGRTGAVRSLYDRHGPLVPGRDLQLTLADREAAVAIALGFVRDDPSLLGLTAADFAEVEVTDVVFARLTGVTHVYFRQRADGIPVLNGQLQVHVGGDGAILGVNHRWVPALRQNRIATVATITPETALTSAAAHLGLRQQPMPAVVRGLGGADHETWLDAPELSLAPVEARLMWLPVGRGAHLVWSFAILTTDDRHHYDFTVDAVTGEVWTRFDRVMDASYRVFSEPLESPLYATPQPPADGRSLVIDPQHPQASPWGWHSDGITNYTITRGNNVYAYEDRDADDQPPATNVDCGVAIACDFPLDLSRAPEESIPAAVANLFYWSNLVHDVEWFYGFDEPAGNFQVDNLGRGGLGGDPVHAQAIDGSGVCNANFWVNADGFPARMQMFQCNLTTPARDGDFDNLIIVHEYGHGLSHRQVGGPSQVSCLSNRQRPSEGLSDWWALVHTAAPSDQGGDARGAGCYLFGFGAGCSGARPQPYSTDPEVNDYTYESIGGYVVPHGVGSVFAQAAWEVYWALVDRYGFNPELREPDFQSGNQRALLYFNEGLKNTACSPTFVDVRDGIVQAARDFDSGADVCLVWQTFAAFGLGLDADDGGSPDSLTVRNGFDVPPECLAPSISLMGTGSTDACSSPSTNVNGIWEPGDTIQIQVDLRASRGSLAGVSGTLTSSDPNVIIIDGFATWPTLLDGVVARSEGPHFTIKLARSTPCLSTVGLRLRVTGSAGGHGQIVGNFAFSGSVGRPYVAGDVPLSLVDPGTATSALDMVENHVLTDLNVYVDISHTWVADLRIELESPAGTRVTLLDRPGLPVPGPGCADNDMKVTFDDSSAVDLESHCRGTTPWYSGTGRPFSPLLQFNGESTLGVWKLHVTDLASGDSGILNDWRLDTTPATPGTCATCSDPWLEIWHDFFAVDSRETPMVGDFDGDGRTDIITFTRDNPVAVGDVYVALSQGNRFGANTKWHDWFAIRQDETVVIGDYDGDGKGDIATWLGATTRQVYVARSTGGGMTPESLWLSAIGSGPGDVLLSGDADGDGRDDLILFGRTQGQVLVARSTGSGFAAPAVWHAFFAVSTHERPEVGDLNGDGKADIVTFATNSPTAYGDVYTALSTGSRFGDGQGSAKWHDFFAINPAEVVRLGDYDGDSRDDFFTFLPSPSHQVYTVRSLGNGMGASDLYMSLSPTPGSGDEYFVGDADGNGKADIIWFAKSVGRVRVQLR